MIADAFPPITLADALALPPVVERVYVQAALREFMQEGEGLSPDRVACTRQRLAPRDMRFYLCVTTLRLRRGYYVHYFAVKGKGDTDYRFSPAGQMQVIR